MRNWMMTRRIPGKPVARKGTGRTPRLRFAVLAVAGATIWLGGTRPAAAQDVTVESRQECRCVDRNGNEIENCTCMRAPRISVVRPLLAAMSPRRSVIGVYIDYGQDDAASAQGGALITEVREDGPADEAGFQEGDLVVSVGGHALTAPLEDAEAEESLDLDQSVAVQRFVHLVGELEPEEPVEFGILRNGERRTLTVTPEAAMGSFALRVGEEPTLFMDGERMRLDLRELRDGELRLRRELEEQAWTEAEAAPRARVWQFQGPEGNAVFRFRGDSLVESGAFTFFESDPCFGMARSQGEGGFSILAGSGNCVDGVELVELNPDLAEYFDAADGGVLVTEVTEESSLGLRAGDVLLTIDGRDVRDAGHVRRILDSYEMSEEIRLRVIRQGREIEVLGRRREG
jgi:membrane-associated protease RseP (regulator of RpoE activity)